MTTQVGFFADKRLGTKEQVVGIDGMDSMLFDTVGVRSHGIRSWEKARYEAYGQRQKQMEYFENQRKLNKLKNANDGPSKKEIQDAADKRREDDRIAAEKLRYDRENQKMGGYEGSCNDAWD